MAENIKILPVSDHCQIPGLKEWLEGFFGTLKRQETREISLTENPEDASFILFFESGIRRLRPFSSNHLLNHPLVKRMPEKCFIWCTEDNPLPWLPGLYASMPARFFDSSIMRAFRYFTCNTETRPLAENKERDVLYSFLGGPSSPQRAAIYRLKHPSSAIVRETRKFNHGCWVTDEALTQYIEILGRSRFTLCPAGAGTSSYRIFEAMRAGSVPVILSDELVLPEGPKWELCSVKIPFRQITEMPKRLSSITNWEEMGNNAQWAYKKYFSSEKILENVARELLFLRMSDFKKTRWAFQGQVAKEGLTRCFIRVKKSFGMTKENNLNLIDKQLQKILMKIRPAIVAAGIKRILRLGRKTVETKEGLFWVDPISQFAISLVSVHGYEPETGKTLRRYLQLGGTFVDIGANEGFFTVQASRIVGPSGRVLAVEPQGRLQEVIRKNLELNGLGNVTLVRRAVSDRPGEAELHISPSTNTGSTGLSQSTRYRVPHESVPVNTLEGILDKHGIEKVDLMKMDIEGFEYEALTGAEKLLKSKQIRAIALEMHPELMRGRGKEPERLEAVLAQSGYRQDPKAKTNVWIC
jgi:FkbM family methyltransferase